MSIGTLRSAFGISLVTMLVSFYGCGSEERDFSGTPDAGNDTGSGGSAASGGSGGGSSGKGGTGGTGGKGGTGGSGAVDSGSDGPTTCSTSADCVDENECNGTETCAAGSCAAGSLPAAGTECVPGGTDVSDSGVQYACHAGACVARCTTDAECDDGDLCTGTESCNPTDNVCQRGTALVCDDSDDCTDNECDPLRGCFYTLTDADGDGQAVTSLGACGTDCNDDDPTIYLGAEELCDSKDNNCNSSTDETAPTWYADCDGDTFAPTAATSVQQCAKPTGAPVGCTLATGTWTSKAPAPGVTDCWDQDANARPRTASEDGTAWSATAIASAPTAIDFDWNCDTLEEKRYPTVRVSTTAACSYTCGGILCFCSGPSGYTGTTSPACGLGGQYTSCNITTCGRIISTQTQQCR